MRFNINLLKYLLFNSYLFSNNLYCSYFHKYFEVHFHIYYFAVSAHIVVVHTSNYSSQAVGWSAVGTHSSCYFEAVAPRVAAARLVPAYLHCHSLRKVVTDLLFYKAQGP